MIPVHVINNVTNNITLETEYTVLWKSLKSKR